MRTRPETPAEYATVQQIHTLAFGGPNESRVVSGVRQSPHFIPELSLVAVLDNQIAGHVLFSWVGLESFPPDESRVEARGVVRKVIVLAPLAVHPDFQNRGVGKALVEEGLRRLEAMGQPLVVVRGSPTYYPRFGFVRAETLGIVPPFETKPGEYQAKPLSAYRPEFRGTVRYPAAFAAVGYPVQF